MFDIWCLVLYSRFVFNVFNIDNITGKIKINSRRLPSCSGQITEVFDCRMGISDIGFKGHTEP